MIEIWQGKDFNYTDKYYGAVVSSYLEDRLR